jgi:7-cyano-7-deazaguanine synthase
MVSHLTALAGDKPMPMSDISDRQATVVPFRNFFILLALSAIAYDTDAVFVAMAINRNDRIIYYDCRPNVLLKILRHVQDCMSFHKKNDTLALLLPFADFTKSQIIQTGSRLGVDFNLTHTCYNGEYPACGTCHSCMDRLSAFRDAGLEDPIIYKVIPKRKGFEFIASLEKNNE